jgi:thymidylate synthase (FAD)
MKIVKASFEILGNPNPEEILKAIEIAGRKCYKSEDKITPESSKRFVEGIIKSGHESVLEHQSISVNIICDRGVSHQLVRHRIASYSQESTRYCNYSKDKFSNEVTFVEPFFWRDSNPLKLLWEKSMEYAEWIYLEMIKNGAKPQEARSVLPNSLKTEITMTMNLRQWRHFFKLRTSSKAHPQMREIAVPMLCDFTNLLPEVFKDITQDFFKKD